MLGMKDTAEAVMKREVVTVSPEVTVSQAAKVMEARKIGSVVVVEKGKVLGILTERDVLRVVARGLDTAKVSVGEVMSRPVVTCESRARVLSLVELMKEKQIRHLPVLSGGEIVGIVSARDIAYYISARRGLGDMEALQSLYFEL